MKRRKIISWSLVLIWMGVIFFFSAQSRSESSALSGGLTEKIIAFIQYFNSHIALQVSALESILRTNAHFIVYSILGSLILNALHLGKTTPYISQSIVAWTISILFAISDEIHQHFVPGRSAQVIDVLVDSAGALAGILFFLLIINLKTKISKQKTVKKTS